MRESKIQAEIKQYLKKMGWLVLKIIQLSENGFPDLYSFKEGRTIWWEVKRPGQLASPLQLLRIQMLRDAGMESYVVDSLESVKKHIACK